MTVTTTVVERATAVTNSRSYYPGNANTMRATSTNTATHAASAHISFERYVMLAALFVDSVDYHFNHYGTDGSALTTTFIHNLLVPAV